MLKKQSIILTSDSGVGKSYLASNTPSSQISISIWFPLIGENTIADTILDCTVCSFHRMVLSGKDKLFGFETTIFRIILWLFKVTSFDQNRWHSLTEITKTSRKNS